MPKRSRTTGWTTGAALACVLAAPFAAHAALPQQSGTVEVPTQANVQIDGATAGDQAGFDVSAAGDVNGDGLDDVIVAANLADNNGRADSGSVYVVFGSTSTDRVDLSALGARGFRIDHAASGDMGMLLTDLLAPAGDLNGDGLADLVVGAPNADSNGRAESGSAYVVFGKATTESIDLALLGSAGFRIDGAVVGDTAATAVASVADMNGDGLRELVVGAPGADNNGRLGSGSAYVVFGKGSTTSVDLAALGANGFSIDGATAGDELGRGVAPIDDLNGDGRPEVVVSAREADNNGRADSGSAYVVFGTGSTTSIDLAALGANGFRIDGESADDKLGDRAVAGIADLNGDGKPEVMLGTIRSDYNGRADSGSAYVVFGKSSSTSVDLAALGGLGYRIDGPLANGQAALRVADVGDLDGDGRPSMMLATLTADVSGISYAISPRTSALDLASFGTGDGLRIDGTGGELLAGSFAGRFDFNGDSRPDLILGAAFADQNGRTNSGSAYILYGYGDPVLAYDKLTVEEGTKVAAHVASQLKRTGAASFSVSPALPAGLSLDTATGTVSGTPTATQAATTHDVTMSDLAGSITAPLSIEVQARAAEQPAASPSAPVATPPAGQPLLQAPPDVTPPRLLRIDLSRVRFYALASSRRPSGARRGASRRIGTHIEYEVDENARLRLTVERRTQGLVVGSQCRARRSVAGSSARAPAAAASRSRQRKGKRKAKRKRKAKAKPKPKPCNRYRRMGRVSRNLDRGRGRVLFDGRVGGKPLARGAYRAVIFAEDSAGNRSKTKRLSFRVLGLAHPKRCYSRRHFEVRIRAPRGTRVRDARVTLRGKRLEVRRKDGRLRATVDLRDRREGTYVLRISVRAPGGRRATGTRTYRTCTARKAAPRPPRL